MTRFTPMSAAVLILCAVPTFARAAACPGQPGHPRVPFIDANCDGCFDVADGDDADVTPAELTQQPFLIPGCFVVPKGAHVTIAGALYWRTQDVGQSVSIFGDVAVVSNRNESLRIVARNELTIGGNIRTSLVNVRTDESPRANITLEGGRGVAVLPGARLNAKGGLGLQVGEGGELIVAPGTKLNASKGEVSLRAEARDIHGPWAPPAGRIQIGAGTKIKARTHVQIEAAGDLDVGAGVAIDAKNGPDAPSIRIVAGYRVSQIDSDLGGNVTIGPKFLAKAPTAMTIAANGTIQVGPGAKLTVPRFPLSFAAVGDLVVDGMKATSYGFDASSQTGDVTVSGKLKSKPAVAAPIAVEAPAGTCDVSGLQGLGSAEITYDCATVVGP